MFFTRLKIFLLAAILLGSFSYFLIYKIDIYVKNQAASMLSSELSSVANIVFSNTNIMHNAPAHHTIAFDSLKTQSGFKDFWFSRSDVISDGLGKPRASLKDVIERKANLTKSNEASIAKIHNTNQNLFRISVPVIASQSCLSCHSGLKAGDIAGSVNASFIFNDTMFAIYDSMKIELLSIIVVASLVFMFIMLSSINSFTKLVFSLKNAIQGAIGGDFTIRIKKHGVGIFSDATKLSNQLLEVLDKSITSIDVKIASIFIYKKSSYSKNPLLRITELIAEITNLFLFKNKIEAARKNTEVCREIQNVISRYIKYKYLIFAEIVDGNIVSGCRIEDNNESKIVVGDVRSIEKRLEAENPNIIFNDDKGCVFISTSVDQLNVIDLKIYISDDIMFYYSIVLNSKKDLIEKENSIIRIYNYIREARPIIKNNILVKSIEESSYTDPLTKAYNRLYLEKYALSIEGKLKQHISFGVLMLDIDHFKKVNDTYGHAVGDSAICLLTDTIRKAIRANDKLFRYGGEEFVVILEGCDMKSAQVVAEKIRTMFIVAKTCGFCASDDKCSLMEINFNKSVSIGVSVMPDFSKDIWECINQADLALYEAKEKGRNRVIKYSPELKAKEAQKNKQDNSLQNTSQNSNASSTSNANEEDDDERAFLESLKLNDRL